MASLKLAVAALVLVMAVSVNSEHLGHFLTRRAILLDDNFAPIATVAEAPAAAPRAEPMVVLQRRRRDTGYAPPVHHQPYKKGKVGPVYTFVKTDYNGNFKWGVRHRAGAQYGGGYH